MVSGRWTRSDRDLPHPDAGLQAERTAMAWQRTALGVGGVSALLLHQTRGDLLTAVPGLFGLVVATALLVFSELRYEHTLRRVDAGRDVSAAPLMLLLAGTVTMLGPLAIGLILVEGSP